MRVALSFPGFHRRGGVERVFVECATYLSGRGHEVSVFAREAGECTLPIQIERLVCRTTPSFLSPVFFFRECTRRMTRKSFDVHGAFGSECPLGGVFWAQSVHKAWLERVKAFRPAMSLNRWKQRLNPLHPVLLHLENKHFGKRSYRKIIALTPEVQGDLQRFYDVPKEDVVVIPNGVSLTEFSVRRCSTLRSEMRQKFGYSDSDKVVIFVANELERKGFGPLLRAVESLKDERIKILAVGRLDQRAGGDSNRVQFTGPTNDTGRYFAAADIFALPTQYEAWGLVIIEALACGIPCLTSRLAGAAIAVREGFSGELLDDPRDETEISSKLGLILSREKGNSEMIAETVRQYSWDRVLERYEQVLSECSG